MPSPLSDEERQRYSWQLTVPDFGEQGQQRLRSASVLISRVGGVGGLVAYQLAAAGVGRLVLAHAGNLRLDDLNRQLLMRHDSIGSPRVEIAARSLLDLNPLVQVEAVHENIDESNADRLIAGVDLVVSCAPLFSERLAMNRAAVKSNRPLIDCAMYELQVQVTTVFPGRSPCLACLYPEVPSDWERRFPVFGAVSGVAGCLGAVEAIKVLIGIGTPLTGEMLLGDLRDMSVRKLKCARRADCKVCASR